MTERWCKSSLAVVLTSVMLYGWIDQKIKGLARTGKLDLEKYKLRPELSCWRVVSAKTIGRKIDFEGNRFVEWTAYF